MKKEEFSESIEMPIETANVENLRRIIESKSTLIKKALGINDVSIEVTENSIVFPWFDELITDKDKSHAYISFIAALCKFSKGLQRVNKVETDVENEKYAFRCFLIRLGFIGGEYKKDRKILLENLDGSAAYKKKNG